MTKEEIIYFAGLVDGEGYVGITTKGKRVSGETKYQVIFRIMLTNLEVIQKYSDILGGHVKTYYKDHPVWKDAYGFSFYDEKAEGVLRLILPYLIVKRLQVEKMLEFRKTVSRGRNQYSDKKEAFAKQHIIYNEMKVLNKRGK